MSDDTPRRMKRLRRKIEKPSEEFVKEKSTDISIKEIDGFRKKHERYPDSDELDTISENVFMQLKKEMAKTKATEETITKGLYFGKEGGKEKSILEKREERRGRYRKKHLEEKQDKEGETSVGKELSNESVTKEEHEIDFKKLASVDELASLENDPSMKDDFDLIEKETESSENSCPNCNSKTKELIYCPNCGQAFCDHCAAQVEVMQDSIKYSCPKCEHEFKKRKRT